MKNEEIISYSQCVYLNNIYSRKQPFSNGEMINMRIVKNDFLNEDIIKTKIKNGFFYLIFPEYEINHYNYLNPISETYKFHLFKFHS